jgi:hypothetical protein
VEQLPWPPPAVGCENPDALSVGVPPWSCTSGMHWGDEGLAGREAGILQSEIDPKVDGGLANCAGEPRVNCRQTTCACHTGDMTRQADTHRQFPRESLDDVELRCRPEILAFIGSIIRVQLTCLC